MITFPALTVGFRLPSNIANATNSVALWPGSMAGAIGFWNLLPKTAKYFRLLVIPTILGSLVGAELFIHSSTKMFDRVSPWLILLAACLLLFQPKVKSYVFKHGATMSPTIGAFIQFWVAVYGGYFGAGMGIMMLAAFALFMEGTIHELNAVAICLTIGSIVGGFYAAKLSQKVNPDKMRIVIAGYGILAGMYFMYKAFRPPSWPSIG